MQLEAIVIGGGISGLVTAYRLGRLGRRILLLERESFPGGVIRTINADGFLVETGPNSLRGTDEFLDLIDELKLRDELVTADPRAPAYIYARGRLHAVPMGPVAAIRTKLLSASAKLRLLGEPFVPPRRAEGEESVASFVRRRLGPEALDYIIAPFISGVYAGDPEELSLPATFSRFAEFEAQAGSIIRGALGLGPVRRERDSQRRRSLRPYRLCSFRRGLQTLIDALARALGETLLTGIDVRRITHQSAGGSNGRFELELSRDRERINLSTDHLILATPAGPASRLLADLAPEISASISEIRYTSLNIVPLAYRANQVSHPLDGFGFLAPRHEGLRTLGSIWNTSLFPDRAPEGWTLLTNFIGGETDPAAAGLTDDQLVSIVNDDLRRVIGVQGKPRPLPLTRYERAIPQYLIGHAARVAKIEAALHNIPGLWLAGNYLRGVALGERIKESEKIARALDAGRGSIS